MTRETSVVDRVRDAVRVVKKRLIKTLLEGVLELVGRIGSGEVLDRLENMGAATSEGKKKHHFPFKIFNFKRKMRSFNIQNFKRKMGF